MDAPPTKIYTLSLHDALPISRQLLSGLARMGRATGDRALHEKAGDRKSTRLNSSHRTISYAVFCLKKKIIEKRASLFMGGEQGLHLPSKFRVVDCLKQRRALG